MNQYHHLTTQERAIILHDLSNRLNLRKIAIKINRSPSTLSSELQRNHANPSNYSAIDASVAYQRRRKHCIKPSKLQIGTRLYDKVYDILTKSYWSTEHISAKLKKDYPTRTTMHVSHETIYAHIYEHPKGELKKLLVSSLRQGKTKPGQRGSARTSYSSLKIVPEQYISERPNEINSRQIVGHWEGDLVVGKMNQSCVGTLVERKTDFVIICKIRNKSAEAVRESFEINMKTLPTFLRVSMTYDRAAEMSQHPIMSKNLDMKI